MPFEEGIKQILLAGVHISGDTDASQYLQKIQQQSWYEQIAFWPYHERGELDVIIELDQVIIGIEVKLHSGLSSEGEDNVQLEQSNNQLTREMDILTVE